MNDECELLNECGFFRKYRTVNDKACEALICQYCRGHDMDKCKRKAHRKTHGEPPCDDMMPSGIINPAPQGS